MAGKFGEKTHAEITRELGVHRRVGEPSPPHPSVGRLGSQTIRQRIDKSFGTRPWENQMDSNMPEKDSIIDALMKRLKAHRLQKFDKKK